jgi:predicted DNA-binding transcriptional regulator AlpA
VTDLLRLDQTVALVKRLKPDEPMSPVTLWRRMRTEGFPKPVMQRGINYWSAAEVERWVANRPVLP